MTTVILFEEYDFLLLLNALFYFELWNLNRQTHTTVLNPVISPRLRVAKITSSL